MWEQLHKLRCHTITTICLCPVFNPSWIFSFASPPESGSASWSPEEGCPPVLWHAIKQKTWILITLQGFLGFKGFYIIEGIWSKKKNSFFQNSWGKKGQSVILTHLKPERPMLWTHTIFHFQQISEIHQKSTTKKWLIQLKKAFTPPSNCALSLLINTQNVIFHQMQCLYNLKNGWDFSFMVNKVWSCTDQPVVTGMITFTNPLKLWNISLFYIKSGNILQVQY